MKIKSGGSDTVYDIPYLQRKGLLKKPTPTKFESGHSFQEGYAVLTPEDFQHPQNSSSASPSPVIVPATTSTDAPPSPFSFLDSLASASSPQTQTYSPSTSAPDVQQLTADLANAKVKIEDLEYKIDRLIERLEKLEMQKLQ